MIKKMREFAPVVMWIVVVAFIGTIFFSWGMNYSSRQKVPYVGKIGKDKISLQYFSRLVDMEKKRLRDQTGRELSESQSRMIPKRVWDENIVSATLHSRAFKDLGLLGTADEIFEYLKDNPPPQVLTIPVFQTDSVFDTAKFVQFLNTPESYDNEGMLQLESHVRNFLVPMNNLRILLESGVSLSRVEVAREYRAKNEKVMFEYAKVSANDFKVDSSRVTNSMINKYYSAHPDSFIAKSSAKITYLKIPKIVTKEDEKTYLEELVAIKSRIEDGESKFAEEARIESDDEGTAENGGDLGWFKRGSMVPEFDSVAFSMKVGQISDPIKTKFGYHLIYLEDRRKVKGVEEIKASHILRKMMPTMETLDSLEAFCDSLLVVMNEKGFTETINSDSSLSSVETPYFFKGDYVPGIGYLSGLMSFAFRNDIGSISDPIEDKNAFYIIKLDDRTKKGKLPLSRVTQDIKNILQDSLTRVSAREYLEKAVSKVSNNSILSLGNNDSLIISGVTDTVIRKQFVKDIGYDNEAISVAFAVKLNNISPVINVQNNFVVVKPVYVQKIKDIPWDSTDVKIVEQELKNAQIQQVYYNWYSSVKNSAQIEDNVAEYFLN